MNQDELMRILPHRAPMLLVDEAELVDGAAVGRYTVRGDEFFLQGHFPQNPVVPGVMLCEMMGQSACVLLADKAGGFTPYFTGMTNVRFRRQVRPGDTIEFRSELTKTRAHFYFIKCTGHVEGRLCVSGELSFAAVPNGE